MSTTALNAGKIPRINSVDILRGLVMIIMALDHVRDYMYPIQFNPADMTQSYPELFWTRWITHFCAPVFIFLAGTSASLWEWVKGKSKKELSWLLFSRGIWLMLVEIFLINPLWTFQLQWAGGFVQVIWVIGLSMVVLAALIHLPWKVLLWGSLATIFIHNYFDDNNFFSDATINGEGWVMWIWTILHEDGPMFIDGNYFYYVAYPLIPWFAVMALGYCFGKVYQLEAAARKKLLIQIGLATIAAYFFIRGINIYGDPKPWAVQDNFMLTVISFFNTEKYPPSLQYLLMTLGPSMLLLAWFETLKGKAMDIISIYGKVPFFYYILHLFLAHLLALVVGVAMGFPAGGFMNGFWAFPEGFGTGLLGSYLGTIVVVAAVYPACKWYAGLKKRSKNPIWTYL